MTKVYPNTTPSPVAVLESSPITTGGVSDGKMTKVYPSTGISIPSPVASPTDGKAAVITVWKKSLLFNCNGFTVFDAKGNLIFRVDNYLSGNKGEIVLMDAEGKPLLTIRRKRLCLGDCWLVYDGETAVNPRFSVKKNVNPLNSKSLAYVTGSCGGKGRKHDKLYEMEGSYAQRCCAVYDDKRRRVAEIKRKETTEKGVAFGVDVFRLVVQQELELTDAMAFVILLDQMFGTGRFSGFSQR
ncbi:PREDICTED: protein LURP-one-related 8-like [Nelumbo nucifera]|uniref:Protein LURP-one-related 8-like n=2 Tax=Nelumbo nucifera TaxID=4432 RepID=A0A1U8BBY5_NELNU|nr:PREDICTED: protein LURP-one-related 8-like [Nelumbo nucifera]DAD38531.1 TPA_asm: hypothetical protein HUJ06_012853 [Nelumbo nucifera]